MPELPEVEAARRAVEEHCVGKRIRRAVVADDPKVVDGVAPADLEAALTGKTVLAALRKGKNLWLRLDSPPFPSFQFGMTGAIHIKGVDVTKYKRSAVNSEEEWPSKYSKVFLEFDDGLELSFTDKRRFARVRLLQDPESMPPISELGPDALLEPMKLDEFMESLKSKKTPIKALLLDQSFIAGIGNWVADEVLYHARIHPLQIAAGLSREKCEALHKCIKEVLEKALEVGADSSQFPSNWIFHYREKKPGKAFVDGKKIEFITVGGRTSAYVPELQKLDGSKSGKTSDGKDKGNLSKSKPKKGQKATGATKKAPVKKRSRASPEDKGGSGTGEDEDKEEPEGEGEESTQKARSKKGKSTSRATKTPATKKGTGLVPDDEEGPKKKAVKGAAKEQTTMKEKASKKRMKMGQTSAQQQLKKRRK